MTGIMKNSPGPFRARNLPSRNITARSHWSAIPKDSILKYKTAVKSGKYVLIAHGSDVETVHAREIISRTNPEALEEHQPACASTKTCAVGA